MDAPEYDTHHDLSGLREERGRTSQPGLEPLPYSDLEVAGPRGGLSQSATYEKPSALPEHTHCCDAAAVFPASACSRMSDVLSARPSTGTGTGTPGNFRREAVCGVKRRAFWVILTLAVFALVLAVGLAVVLSLVLRDDRAGGDDGTSSDAATPTIGLPSPLATAKTSERAIVCPSDNRTLYTANPNTTTAYPKKFLLLCGRDYNQGGGSIDIGNTPIKTMTDCIDLCAGGQDCVGAGWGLYDGDYRCWLKSSLGAPNVSGNWYFAVEMDERTASTTFEVE